MYFFHQCLRLITKEYCTSIKPGFLRGCYLLMKWINAAHTHTDRWQYFLLWNGFQAPAICAWIWGDFNQSIHCQTAQPSLHRWPCHRCLWTGSYKHEYLLRGHPPVCIQGLGYRAPQNNPWLSLPKAHALVMWWPTDGAIQVIQPCIWTYAQGVIVYYYQHRL